MERKIQFAYWGVHAHNRTRRQYDEMTFTSVFEAVVERDPKIFFNNWDLIEFLITAPEPPVVDLEYDGEPIYTEHVHEKEAVRNDIYKYVSEGEVIFSTEKERIFGEFRFSREFVVRWVNWFIDNMGDEDYDEFKEIYYAWDSGHTIYKPLFEQDTTQ